MLKLRTYSGYKSPREMKHVGEVPERDPPPYGRGNSSIRMYICDVIVPWKVPCIYFLSKKSDSQLATVDGSEILH